MNSAAGISTKRMCLLVMSMTLLVCTTDAFSSPIGCGGISSGHKTSTSFPTTVMFDNKESSDSTVDDTEISTIPTTNLSEGLEKVFSSVDLDNSGAIDLEEYNVRLLSAGYSEEEINDSFRKIDADGSGEISREEFIAAISNMEAGSNCAMGYWLDSVTEKCKPLGPLGRFSQRLENIGPLKKVSKKISNLFGIDRKEIRKKGVGFMLAYNIISNLNGAVSLSVAWYLTVKRTGISPFVPGQKRALLASWAMIYGPLQLLKPFRVAAAIGMSKLSAEYLEMTEEKFSCSRNVAIGCQFMTGQLMMGLTFFVGINIVRALTGVPIRGYKPGSLVL